MGIVHVIDVMHDIRQLLDAYHAWLRDETALREIGQWVEITTPYLDRHNDYVQIYAREANGGFLLTDDGYTLNDLEQNGCKLDSSKRRDLLRMTLNGFGVQQDDKALQVHASPDNFALRKHNLVQAILAVNDMFYLAAPLTANLFYEDVAAWLDVHDIRYTPRVKFTGKSGYDHLFDFVIPRSRRQPERILRAINRPNRDTAQAVIFSWNDTKERRAPESCAYAMLNDAEQTIAPAVMGAFRSYEAQPILWSQRENAREELAA